MTVLRAVGATPYEVTAEDKLWLLRAVEVEGAPREGVARTLVNLFMRTRANGSRQSLGALVRAYAQPVNPRWFPQGDKFLQAQAALTSQEARAKALAKAIMREHTHSTRDVFSPQTLAAVDAALESGWAQDWTDYAAPGVGARKGYARRTEDVKGRNTFWSRAPGWAGYESGAGGAGLGLVAVAAGVLGVSLWRKRRKT